MSFHYSNADVAVAVLDIQIERTRALYAWRRREKSRKFKVPERSKSMGVPYISDNSGFISSPTPESSQPVLSQTALQLTNGTKDTDTSATVVAGKRYRFTALNTAGFYFGLATVATAGNVRWACPIYHTIEIQIPAGYTTLHYACDVNSGIGYLVEID